MATSLVGPRSWRMVRDAEGHREYRIIHRVKAGVGDGPANVLLTTGLPVPGSTWDFDDDEDVWAWCRADAEVTPVVEDEPNYYWDVEQIFSTKPPPLNQQRCQDVAIEDPLLEPAKVSGSFTKTTIEAQYDRFGRVLVNSALQRLNGPRVEFDNNKPTVRVEMNVATLDLGVRSAFIDTVNDSPIWGLPARCLKLSNMSWERRYYGQCSIYYTVTMEFDVDFKTFDRDILDEGTKALSGKLDKLTDGVYNLRDVAPGVAPNPLNPTHYNEFQDRNGNPTTVILNGAGLPASVIVKATDASGSPLSGGGYFTGNPGNIHIEYYPGANFLLLGLPTDIV